MAPLLPSRSAALLALVGLSQAIEPPRVPHQPVGGGDRRLTFNETVVGPSLSPRSVSLTWSAAGEDGRYITTNDGGDLVLVDIVSGDEETFVTADALPADVHEYEISSDSSRMLIATNYTKQYRHSYFADYQVLDVKSGELTPLVDDQAGDVQYAKLAPTGDFIAFVRGNDLFLRDHATGDITRVTDNGGPDMFNGVFDWVYEEEVFGDRGSLWFSPDAEYVAFLSFNETGVETFTIPYYMDNQKVAPPYPRELELRYPKVGSTNPTVHLNVLEVATGKFEEVVVDAFPADDLVIGELAWVTDAHEAFIYRAYNRVQDHDVHVVVDPATLESRQVRERDGSDGWLENVLAIQYIGALKNAGNQTSADTTYYVDLSDESGWMHIYLYPVQADGGKPIQLTSGEWEVKSILHVDAKRGLLYYSATKRHSTESHVYKLSLVTGKSTPLVDDETPGFWSSSWSSEGGYYILSYQGPDVPYQEVYAVNSSKPIRVLEDNAAFYEKIEEYALPNITYFELEHPDGYSLNVMQMLPPDFDASKKHPILLTPYGGPNSQSVTKQFQSYGWEAYITSEEELGYITYTVDNRGTALKGREFRSAVTEQLGKLEPVDQTWAASELVKRFGYVDADKVGMFGWSFGGYLTAKTIELDAGVFSHGLIVAPVTDWRFYDSVYTERYMKRLRDNEAGYLETAVHDAAGFRNLAGAAALLHGTGDDNVHYANTAALFDLLVGAGVPSTKLDMTAFTDSDHSIRYNGANVWIYKLMTEKLYQEVQRNPDAGVLAHQWSRRQEERSD